MIRIPIQGPPYYDWGLDRWKIGVALVLFGVLMIWLLATPSVAPWGAGPVPTPVPITLSQPLPGSVEAGMAQRFAGSAPGNSQIRVVDADLGELGQTVADADGQWTVETAQPWTPGAYRLQAVVMDPATGDVLGRSGIIPVVGLSAPLPPLELREQSLEQGEDGSTLVLAGVAPPGLNVSAGWMEGGRAMPLGQSQADPMGRWQIRAAAPPQNDFNLILAARDPTGALVTESAPMPVAVIRPASGTGEATVDVMVDVTPDGTAVVTAATMVDPTDGVGETGSTGSVTETILLPLTVGALPPPSAPADLGSVPDAAGAEDSAGGGPAEAGDGPASSSDPSGGTQSDPRDEAPDDDFDDTSGAVTSEDSPDSPLALSPFPALGLDGLGPGSRIMAGQVDRLAGTGVPNTILPGTVVQAMGRYLPAGEPVTNEAMADMLPERILGAAPVDGTGRWQISLAEPLAWGRHQLTLRQLNAEGETAAQIGPIVLHALSPDAPPMPAPPVILAPAVNGRVAGVDPHFVGTALAGSQLRVQISPALDGPPLSVALAWVSNLGAWSVGLGEQLPNGDYWAEAIALDPSGTESARSEPVPFQVVPLSSLQLPLPGDDVSTASVTTTSSAESDQAVSPAASTPVTSTPVTSTPVTSTPVASTPVASTPATSSSASSNPATARPVPAGSVPAGFVTVNTRLPRFSGSTEAERLLQVQVTDSQGQIQRAVVKSDAGGAWSFVPAMPLSVGTAQASVQLFDLSGQLVSGRGSMVVEVTPNAQLTGASAMGLQLMAPMPGLLSNRLPPIWGLTQPDATVTVLVDGETLATVQADSRGYWFAAPPAPLADGVHQLTLSSLPAAGDPGNESRLGPLALTVAASTPTIFQPAIDTPNQRADTARFVMAGTAQPGQTVAIVINGVERAQVVADGAGRWRWSVTEPQAEGPIYLQARILDAEGTVLAESPVQVVLFYVPLGG